MIRKIRKIFDNKKVRNFFTQLDTFISRDSDQKNKGQIAVIMALVLAMSLVFYAASLNFGKISQTKTNITIASNVGASLLASQVSSMGQAIFMQTLGGKLKRCKFTGLLVLVIVIIVIISCIYALCSGAGAGAGAAGAGAGISAASLGLALSVAALVIQIAYIEPGVVSQLNKKFAATLTQSEQILEQGLRQGLVTAVTDNTRIADATDLDTDSVWGFDSATLIPKDTVGRFEHYYDWMATQYAGPDLTRMQAFLVGLRDFMYERSDSWALLDPVPGSIYSEVNCAPGDTHPCCYTFGDLDVPSQCNPCCIPTEVCEPSSASNGAVIECKLNKTAPERCDNGNPFTQIGTATTCRQNSPYGLTTDVDGSLYTDIGGLTMPTQYELVYNPYYENSLNDPPTSASPFLSFRELLGVDDEHQLYRANPEYPMYRLNPGGPLGGQQSAVPVLPVSEQGFEYDDTAANYVPPVYTPTIAPDTRQDNLYRDLHLFSDGVIDTLPKQVTVPGLPAGTDCHWCEADYGALSLAPPIQCGFNQPLRLPQLNLPLLPTTLTTALAQGDCVDVKIDKVGSVSKDSTPVILSLLADPLLECAQDAFDDLSADPDLGFWKPGADAYCSRGDITPQGIEWPYNLNCLKHHIDSNVTSLDCAVTDGGEDISVYCTCQESGKAAIWHDDVIDDIYYGLGIFITEMHNVVLLNTALTLFNAFPDWFPEIEAWISPGNPALISGYSVPCFDSDTGGPCPSGSPPGRLWIFLRNIREISSRLSDWRNAVFWDALSDDDDGDGTNETHEVWESAYCFPQPAGNPRFQLGINGTPEGNTYDSYGSSAYGELDDVLACLNYYVEGFSGGSLNVPGTRLGADYAYFKCDAFCSAATCTGLPRSPLPRSQSQGFDQTNMPILRNAADDVDVFRMLRCLRTCSNEFCDLSSPEGLLPVQTSTATPYPYSALATPFVDDVTLPTTTCAVDPAMALVDVQDFRMVNRCLYNCSDVTCQALPTTHLSSGVLFPWPRPAAAFDETVDCDPLNPEVPTMEWAIPLYHARDNLLAKGGPGLIVTGTVGLGSIRDSILEALNITESGDPLVPGMCTPNTDLDGDADSQTDLSTFAGVEDNSFITNVNLSMRDLFNIVAKMEHRRNYLADVIAGVDRAITTMDFADLNFTNFLTGPAADLIQDRIDYVTYDSGFTPHTIYGWRGDPPPSRTEGYWHIVKVEARIPTKCDGACNTAQDPSLEEPGLPRVKAYSKSFGLRRCYRLTNTAGTVKFRVTRFDENPDTTAIKFPNGEDIWKFSSSHPDQPNAGATIFNLATTCNSVMTDAAPTLPPSSPISQAAFEGTYFSNAFIMGERWSGADAPLPANDACWDAANRILADGGVVSETCAQYYYHEGIRKGMGFQFVDCLEF